MLFTQVFYMYTFIYIYKTFIFIENININSFLCIFAPETQIHAKTPRKHFNNLDRIRQVIREKERFCRLLGGSRA